MADSAAQLVEYKLQFQQVEAALTTDPDNEDLRKLHDDLKEVINLTEDLLAAQSLTESSDDVLPSSSAARGGARTSAPPGGASLYDWDVGDRCSALYTEDQSYYNATIEEVLQDGSCTVTFDGYGNSEVVPLSSLRAVSETSSESGGGGGGAEKRPASEASGSAGAPEQKKPMTKKDMLIAQREYKRKKSQKKQERRKQLEEEREKEKNKWLDFNAKAFSKTNKGKVKKSIFATPDSDGGRVGVGTCGMGGRQMTSYTRQEKWHKK